MSPSHSLVTLPTTEQETLISADGGREYRLFISLPHSYYTSERTYPVIYMLDGNSLFPISTEIVRLLHFDNEIREVIIVGIGYPDADTFKATMPIRTRDFTPSVSNWYETRYRADAPDAPASLGEGEAATFLRFLNETLAAFIGKQYRIDPVDTTLVGFSFGGLFALYNLFTQPHAFRQYFICSPSIWWDNAMIFECEKTYAAQHSDLSARIFLSVGGAEPATMVAGMYRMVQTLRDRDYKSLELITHFFEGETHMSVVPAFLSRCIRTAFANTA